MLFRKLSHHSPASVPQIRKELEGFFAGHEEHYKANKIISIQYNLNFFSLRCDIFQSNFRQNVLQAKQICKLYYIRIIKKIMLNYVKNNPGTGFLLKETQEQCSKKTQQWLKINITSHAKDNNYFKF